MAREAGNASSTPRGSFYGRENATVASVLGQIVVVQCCFYFSFTLALLCVNFIAGADARLLDQMFSAQHLNLSNVPGWSAVISFVIAATIPTTLAIVYAVGRSRKCLDFAATTFSLHLFFSSIYGGFPDNRTWWVLNVGAGTVVTLMGEYFCSRRELLEIPVPAAPAPSTEEVAKV